jgi:hypothetical protein
VLLKRPPLRSPYHALIASPRASPARSWQQMMRARLGIDKNTSWADWAEEEEEAVPLDQLTGANGACSSCVGTPIACTLEHASATRARRGVTARAKKKRRVCVFTQRTFTSPGPWPLSVGVINRHKKPGVAIWRARDELLGRKHGN